MPAPDSSFNELVKGKKVERYFAFMQTFFPNMVSSRQHNTVQTTFKFSNRFLRVLSKYNSHNNIFFIK